MNTELLKIKEKIIKETPSKVYLDKLLEEIILFIHWISSFPNQWPYKEIHNDFLRLIRHESIFNAYSAKEFFHFVEKKYSELNNNGDINTSKKCFRKKKTANEVAKNKPNNEENYINYLNFYIEFLFKIINTLKIQEIKKEDRYINFWADFQELIKNIEYYSYKFDYKNKNIVPSESLLLLENISFYPLNEIVYKYRSSMDLEEKHSYFSSLAIKMLCLFKKDSDCRKALEKYFSNEILNNFKKECNGYFRHSKGDSENETTKEWMDFTNEKKIKIMDETLNFYLFALSILRTNELLEKFENNFNKQ